MFTNGAVSGALLRELRTAAGIGLRTMATRTAFIPSYLSMVETGRKPVTNAVLEAYRNLLGDPTLGLPDVDVDRLAATVADPAGAGTSSLEDISVILERTRRLEDTAGAFLVLPVIRGIDGLARALTAENVGGSTAASVAAEVAGYRGWLEHDTGHPHISNKAFDDAAQLADTAGDRSQLAHALSFRAYTARSQGDTERAVDLTEAAARVDGAHPILGVYARHQRAEFLAVRGDNRQSVKALVGAEHAADVTDGIDLPSYGYWYTAGFWGLHRGVVLSTLGRRCDGKREAAQGIAAMPSAHQSAGWLTPMLDLIEPGWKP
jgi:transcriptional regulator with XRE-family HTH domain